MMEKRELLNGTIMINKIYSYVPVWSLMFPNNKDDRHEFNMYIAKLSIPRTKWNKIDLTRVIGTTLLDE